MWLNKQSQSAAPSASGPKVPAHNGSPTDTTADTSWLSPTMRVKAEIYGNEDLRVDGKVEGSISVGEHRLTVGHNGKVTGGLAAREIIIYGKVDGDRDVVSGSIEIKRDASIAGNVKTRRIVIEDGAAFKGSIEIEERGKQDDSKLDNSLLARKASSA